MGEWKAQLCLRVRQQLRKEMEIAASQEKRKLGPFSESLLEWAFEQFKSAGSIDRLLKYQLGQKKVQQPEQAGKE